MFEVSCRDLGVADCDFDIMAHSLERLELDVLAHMRYRHPEVYSFADEQEADSPARRELRERILAAARVVDSTFA